MSNRMIKKQSATNLLQRWGLPLLVLLMCVILSFVSPVFLTPRNILNIFQQVSVNGIIAVGMTFVLLTGNIDISVGSLVAVSGVIAGSILVKNPTSISSTVFACIVAVLICMLLSFVSGNMVSYFNVPPMIATLAMMTIARGIALVYADGKPYLLESESFAILGKGNVGGFPLPAIIFFVIIILFSIVLNCTAFGRSVYAVGGNRKAADASGIRSRRIINAVYVICGALTGLAGLVLASRIGSGQPAVAEGYEMDAIAACVIGGTSTLGGIGKLSGTFIGVLIIGLISNALTLLNINTYWQQIIKGLIIAIAVILDMYTKKKN